MWNLDLLLKILKYICRLIIVNISFHSWCFARISPKIYNLTIGLVLLYEYSKHMFMKLTKQKLTCLYYSLLKKRSKMFLFPLCWMNFWNEFCLILCKYLHLTSTFFIFISRSEKKSQTSEKREALPQNIFAGTQDWIFRFCSSQTWCFCSIV